MAYGTLPDLSLTQTDKSKLYFLVLCSSQGICLLGKGSVYFGGGVCLLGGMAPPVLRSSDGHQSGRNLPYWNSFLLMFCFL